MSFKVTDLMMSVGALQDEYTCTLVTRPTGGLGGCVDSLFDRPRPIRKRQDQRCRPDCQRYE
jgi:hypothetical protein